MELKKQKFICPHLRNNYQYLFIIVKRNKNIIYLLKPTVHIHMTNCPHL